jgi:hypothetical protein
MSGADTSTAPKVVRKRLKPGDVFTIPLDESRFVAGQLADKVHAAWFVIVFDGIYDNDESVDIQAATTKPIRLQGLTFNALIRHGVWSLLGNAAVPDDRIRWPVFKVMTDFSPERYAVTDHRGEHQRQSTWRDRGLQNMIFVSPMVLQRAARALHGLEPWRPDFDHLRTSDRQVRRGILGRIGPRRSRDIARR